MNGIPEIVEVGAEQTHPLRLAVLRHDTPTKDVVFAEDSWPGTRHLVARVDGDIVATSTWVPRDYDAMPTHRAVQLRGMATAQHLQSSGLGGQLLEEGCRSAATQGFDLVWARARDAALAFYLRHGFRVEGDGFVDGPTQLPHHVVVRQLDTAPGATGS